MKEIKTTRTSKTVKAKRLAAFFLACMLLLGYVPTNISAVKKTGLSDKKLTIYVGKTKKLKIKNPSSKVTWTVIAGKKVISLSGKTKTSVKIKGKKKGTAKVQAKVGKKKYVCLITVKKLSSTQFSESSQETTGQSVVTTEEKLATTTTENVELTTEIVFATTTQATATTTTQKPATTTQVTTTQTPTTTQHPATNNITWSVDSDGVLTITGTGNYSLANGLPDWSERIDDIKKQ